MKFIKYVPGVILVVFCIGVITLLIIGALHSHPNVEDLELAIFPRDLGIWKGFVHLAITYDGRYSTNFLQCFNPLVFNKVGYYKYTSLFSLSLFLAGVIGISKTIFSAVSMRTCLFIGVLFMSFYFISCPSLAYGLYWMGSSFVYLYPCIFLMFSISAVVLYLSNEKNRTFYFFIAALFLFVGIGFSELFLPFYLVISLAIQVFLFKTQPTVSKHFLPISIWICCCILFMVLTPSVGTRFEGEVISNHLNQAIFYNSIINYWVVFAESLFSVSSLFLMVSGIWFFSITKIRLVYNFTFFETLSLVVIFLVIPYFMTLPFYITKIDISSFPNRVYIPVRFVHYFILFFLIVPSFVQSGIIYRFQVSKKSMAQISAVLLFLFAFWFLISAINGRGSIGMLFQEYKSGKLARFDAHMSSRFKKIALAKQANHSYTFVCVEELIEYPLSLYTHPDKESDRTSSKWNKYMEGYFGIDEIRTKSDQNVRFAPEQIK